MYTKLLHTNQNHLINCGAIINHRTASIRRNKAPYTPTTAGKNQTRDIIGVHFQDISSAIIMPIEPQMDHATNIIGVDDNCPLDCIG